MVARTQLASAGEAAAAHAYESAGYEVVQRNWRCRIGELDLVLRSPSGVIVFCEVKTRSGRGFFGAPEEAVTAAKVRRLRQLAAEWLATSDRTSGADEVRFDVAAVERHPGRGLVVRRLAGAF